MKFIWPFVADSPGIQISRRIIGPFPRARSRRPPITLPSPRVGYAVESTHGRLWNYFKASCVIACTQYLALPRRVHRASASNESVRRRRRRRQQRRRRRRRLDTTTTSTPGVIVTDLPACPRAYAARKTAEIILSSNPTKRRASSAKFIHDADERKIGTSRLCNYYPRDVADVACAIISYADGIVSVIVALS